MLELKHYGLSGNMKVQEVDRDHVSAQSRRVPLQCDSLLPERTRALYLQKNKDEG